MTTELSPDLILGEIERIRASRAFQRASRQKSLLSYLVIETLEGRSDLLKEYSIGIAVFGKEPTFDPRLDSIVRVEAHKLRARLAKYFDTEGKSDPVRVELPVGRYLPVFGTGAALSRQAAPAYRTPWRERLAFRIAVLPFDNRSPGARDHFFADGLTDELNHALAGIRELDVVSRTSAFQFKGRQIDVRELAARLDVDAVIEGSVRRFGDHLRILVQLDDGADGRTVWSQTYDRKRISSFGAQQEIASAISEDLAPQIYARNVLRTAGASNHRRPPSVRNSRAHQDYLQGLFCWNRHTLEDFAEAARCFKRAVEGDVNFARAYTNLAYAHLMLPVLKAVLPAEALRKARLAATKALEIDPSAGEAHIALALPRVQEYQWQAAGEKFRKGLELSPSDAFGHAWYGMYLASVGRPLDALKEHDRALQLEPASPVASCCYGQTLYLLRRHVDAVRHFRTALAPDPCLPRAHAGLGLTYLQQGNYAEGLEELERAQALTPGLGRVKASLAYAYALSTKKDRAREILNEFLKLFRPALFPGLMIAEVYIGLGDKDQAFYWLHRAIDQKDLAPFLTCDPLFDPLRTDSRFSSLLKRTNLA